MIKVKGFRYYNDNKCPRFELEFDNLGQLCYHIQTNTLGKNRIKFPAQNDDGTFNQKFAGSFCGHLYFADEVRYNDADVSSHIELIRDDDGKVLFSSGSLTDGKGHISTPMREMLSNLKAWCEAEYEFVD